MNLRRPPSGPVPIAILLLALATASLVGGGYLSVDRSAQRGTMLILRGIANEENPRGQLDDRSALEYARRSGYRGEVLDAAGNTGAESPQVKMALSYIRANTKITAIYGFSGGGYNTKTIWKLLNENERQRLEKVVIVGAPGVDKSDFPGSANVLIQSDPPAGHMAGPKVLLDSLGPS